MNFKLVAPLITALILSLGASAIFDNIARADKDYCFDEVGDREPCYKNQSICIFEQKTDYIAETPCYNKDHTY